MKDPSPAQGSHHHRQEAAAEVPTAVITVSDTRTTETDKGGRLVAELLRSAGHPVVTREIVKDDPEAIRSALERRLSRGDARAIVLTGGTGVAPRDVTPDTVAPLFDRTLPGFGELFRMLSFEEIGSAALLSRATAGIARGVVVFVLPGSRGAAKLGMERLILPEIGHLAAEAVKRR